MTDEEDQGTASGHPTFEDLAERLVGAGDPSEPTEGIEAGPQATGSVDELWGDAVEPEESEWQWGGPRSADEGPEEPAEGPARPANEPSTTGGVSLLSESKSEALIELIDDASNVLVLGPDDASVEYDLCTALCSTGARPRRRVLVTTRQSADERLKALRGYGADAFDESTVIAVGDQVRSSRNGEPMTLDLEGERITIETITDPRDLTRLGLLVNKHLVDRDDVAPAVLCFHTLSTLLQFSPVEKVFRFLHVLQGRVRGGGARAHYHLDPGEHPDEVVDMLRPLFDFTVRFDADGDVSVDT